MRIFIFLYLCSKITYILSEVTVLKYVQLIYDKSPKLRIRGSGFDAADHEISIDLGAVGEPPLVVDKDFTISKSDDESSDGIILKLLGNRRWVNVGDREPPIALILSSVKFDSNPKKNLLAEPVIIAQVLNTPSIEENDDIIYSKASNELRINGTGFIGSKEIDLYFQPPLVKEVAYEDVTPYPLETNQVILRLRHDYSWREDGPGPLIVIGVDSGGGPVKVNGDDGIQVAEVQADLDLHGVTVETTSDEQLVYSDDPNLSISGSGFNPIGNTLRWSNGLLGNGVNYTMTSSHESSISLRLTPGSHWRMNFDNLPGVLTLLAVNAGEGFVAVGPTNAKKGRDIAMVFERPDIYSALTKIYQTHSHELHIFGTGFPLLSSGYKPLLKFTPELVVGEDYTIRVVSRTEIEITLLDGKEWRPEPGPIQVTAINTRGDESGWIQLSGRGVHVAEVIEDIDAVKTGGVEVYPMGVKVYQSALQEVIAVTGSGFKDGMSFVLNPALKVNVDYTIEFVSEHQVNLHLVNGKKWSSEASLLIVQSVTIGKDTYPLAGKDGIRVAVILEDPVIDESFETLHESQSKLIIITGSGFTDIESTKVQVRPSDPDAFQVISVIDDMIRLQLNPDRDWLPSFMSLKNEDDDKRINLQIASINTGAGDIIFQTPITVGYIIKDREGVVCDDSCEFAFDGICDDGSEPFDEYYYQNYFQYQDDDFGGYYSFGDDMEDDYRRKLSTTTTREGSTISPPSLSSKMSKANPKSKLISKRISTTSSTFSKLRKSKKSLQQVSSKINSKSKSTESYYDDYYYSYYYYDNAYYYNYDDNAYYYSYDDNYYYDDTRRRLQEGGGEEEEDDYRWEYYGYDDYYMENDEYTVSACVQGTDCTDCGGVDAIIDYSQPLDDDNVETCVNTCSYARDGICDDPRGTMYCAIGTDCQDCGPVGFDNFTVIDDDGWWDDDDDYWNFNDGEFLDQTKGLDANRHKVKAYQADDEEEEGAIFLMILEGMVYTVGAIFLAAACYLIYRWYNGQTVPFTNAFDSELTVQEFEMKKTQKMAITPDEFRT